MHIFYLFIYLYISDSLTRYNKEVTKSHYKIIQSRTVTHGIRSRNPLRSHQCLDLAKFITVRKYILKIPWRKSTLILVYIVLSVEFQSLLSKIIKVVTKLKSVLIVAKFYFWNQYNHIKSISCILQRKPRLALHLCFNK